MKKILLSGKKGIGKYVLIDNDCPEEWASLKWNLNTNGYASHMKWNKTLKKYESLLLHRLIVNCPKDLIVDHINGNKLDNRSSNLRIVTHQQNLWNFKIKDNKIGAYYNKSEKRRKRWTTTIRINGKKAFIGRFLTKEEAVNAYKEAAEIFHGEFSPY